MPRRIQGAESGVPPAPHLPTGPLSAGLDSAMAAAKHSAAPTIRTSRHAGFRVQSGVPPAPHRPQSLCLRGWTRRWLLRSTLQRRPHTELSSAVARATHKAAASEQPRAHSLPLNPSQMDRTADPQVGELSLLEFSLPNLTKAFNQTQLKQNPKLKLKPKPDMT